MFHGFGHGDNLGFKIVMIAENNKKYVLIASWNNKRSGSSRELAFWHSNFCKSYVKIK